MRILLSAIVLSMLVGAFVHAQDGVDFSGRWILKSPSDTLVFESGRYTASVPKPACGQSAAKRGHSTRMVGFMW
jgi:hypothetical protein